MYILTAEIITKLSENGRQAERLSQTCPDAAFDPLPVVKVFTPDAHATWLLSELDPQDSDRAFGLCDLGEGFPELGWISLRQLARVRGPLGLAVRVEHQQDALQRLKVVKGRQHGSNGCSQRRSRRCARSGGRRR